MPITVTPRTAKATIALFFDKATMTREKPKTIKPPHSRPAAGNSSGCISRPRRRSLYAGSLLARSAHDCTAHSTIASPTTITPPMKSRVSIGRPIAATATPNAAARDQAAWRGAGVTSAGAPSSAMASSSRM
jgi:hypothetical protein